MTVRCNLPPKPRLLDNMSVVEVTSRLEELAANAMDRGQIGLAEELEHLAKQLHSYSRSLVRPGCGGKREGSGRFRKVHPDMHEGAAL